MSRVHLRKPTWHPSEGLICWREDGAPRTNVPIIVRHHSPEGPEWGYCGSGPADLALNIAAWAFPVGCDGLAPVKCWDGQVSQLASAVHQAVKFQVVAPLPRDHGDVDGRALAVALWKIASPFAEGEGRVSVAQAILRLWFTVLVLPRFAQYQCRFCKLVASNNTRNKHVQQVAFAASLLTHLASCK